MKTRADYDIALLIVKSVLAEWDPYYLLKNGAPADEFDGEAAKVLMKMRSVRTPQDAAAAVSSVYSASFGATGFSAPDCAEVGSRLFSRLQGAGLLEHDA